MKGVRVLFVLGLILGLGNSAFAQTIGKLTSSSNSVTKVMMDAGCNTGWIFQVLQDSDILVTQLRQLPEGQEIVLKEFKCTDEPPSKIAHMSAIILGRDAAAGQNQKAQRENVALRATATKMLGELEKANREKAELAIQNKNLESKLGQATQTRPVVVAKSNTGYSKVTLGIVALMGLLAGVIGTALFTRVPKSDGEISFARVWTIRDNGEDHVFTLVGVSEAPQDSGKLVGKYKCPHCFERNISGAEGNLRGHLSNAHPKQRIASEVDSSFLDKLDQPLER